MKIYVSRDMQASKDFLPDGSQFVCLSETSKNELTYARKYGRAYSGDRAELRDVVIGIRWWLLLVWTATSLVMLYQVC